MSAPATEGTVRPGPRMARNFAALFTGAAAVRVIALASQVVLARLLGPTAMGSLAVAQALLVFSGVFADGGLTTLSLRDIVRRPESRRQLATLTMVVQIVLATVAAGVMAGIAVFAPWDDRTTLVVLSFCPALICSAMNMAYLLKSAEMMGTLALSRVVATALPAVLSVALVLATRSAVWVGVSTCIGLFVNDVLIYLVLRRRLDFNFVRVALPDVRRTARSGIPMLLTQALLIVPTVAGTIAVYAINGPHDAGLFQAAWQLSYAALLVAALVIDAIYPELVRRSSGGDESFARFVNTALQLAARVTLPSAVVVSFAAPSVIGLLFGAKYAASADILRIAVWVAPLGFFWVILGHALIARDNERTMTRLSFVVTGLTVIATPLAAYGYGAEGAAAALVGASFIQVALYATAPCLHTVGALRALALEVPCAVVPAAAAAALYAAGWGGLMSTILVVGLAAAGYEFVRGAPTVRGVRNLAATRSKGSS